ncbi:unnamed protein product [Paramecium pentaurelia]|uniref:Peptide chain release factor domain-containing protein n=1 Tax=Paramecium pentaurelia TaxID=43138 RepID=A0A8S1XW88_9CILI|nr:unnamed protein product [Paramecium pentaurelia]
MYQEHTINGEMNEIKRRRMNELQPKIHIYKQIQASVSVIEDAKQLISLGGTSDEISMLNEEIQTQIEYLKKYQDEALTQLIEQDEYDHIRQLNVEVRAGVGGSEGSLFAEDIIGMIQNYASLQNWDCRVISIQKDTQIGKGCKTGQYTLDLNVGRDSNILAFLNNYNQIGIYDIRTKMGMHKIKGKLQYNQVIWNKKQENNLIAIDYEAGLIDFYDTRDFKNKYKRIRTDHRQIVKAEWFQDRNSLVTAGLDRQIILYEGDKYLEPCFGLTKNYDIDNFCCQNNLFGVVSEYSFEVFSFETQ